MGIKSRDSYALTDEEFTRFKRIHPEPGEAFKFWRGVAAARGLDAASILAEGRIFTGLPLGHKKNWCHPWRSICKRRPSPDGPN